MKNDTIVRHLRVARLTELLPVTPDLSFSVAGLTPFDNG